MLVKVFCSRAALSLPPGMSLMTQVAGVLKTMAKDFNVAALVRMTRAVRRPGRQRRTFKNKMLEV